MEQEDQNRVENHDENNLELTSIKNETLKKENLTPVKKNYVCICLFAFLMGTDFAVIIPTLWDRLKNDFDSSGVFLGLVMSGYSASGVLSGLAMGYMYDKVQRAKPFFLISIFLAALGHLIYFIGISKYLILIGRIISGLCIGAGTVALAYIAQTTSEEKRTAYISMVMATRQLGLMFGPAFNLCFLYLDFKLFGLFELNRKSAPGLFMAIIWSTCFLAMLILYRDSSAIPSKSSQNEVQEEKTEFLEEKPEAILHVEKLSSKDKQKEFLRFEIFVLLTVTFFTYFNQTSIETIVTPFTEIMFGWSEVENSILFCIGAVIIILSYILIRFLSSKNITDRQILLIGISCIFIGLVIGCACLPFASQLQNPKKYHFKQSKFITNSPSILNETDRVDLGDSISHESLLSNKTSNLYTEKPVYDYKFFPAFVLFVLLDVLGLPAVAITSASLFTKLISKNVQGLGQGIQRGILGVGMIIGPLASGPLVYNPIILIALSLCLITFILILVVVSFKRLIPKATT